MTSGAAWTEGYVTDVSYTNSFFRELSPAWLNYVAAAAGARPRPLDEGFTHIDLGCGLGQSCNLLAACFPQGRFFGVDFNPAHVDSAQHLAAELGLANARFLERSFEELLDADLPDFDFITLHGVYSWIGEDARKAAQRFIYRKLKPGGIVYNSYNCLPGWSADAPIRRLLTEFAATHHGDSASKAEQAAKDAKALADLKLGYFRSNAAAAEHVGKLTSRQTNYLAHEYLNANWVTFYAADVAEEMAQAKLTYLASATLLDNHLELLLPDPAVAYVRKQPTERLRLMAQDYLTGQRFRRDVFIRGHPRLPRAETTRLLRDHCFALPGTVEDFTEKAKVPRGEISFDSKLAAGIRDALAAGSYTLGEIEGKLGAGKPAVGELERTIQVLAASGKVVPVAASYHPQIDAKAKRVRLVGDTNRRLIAAARRSVTRQYLASPAVGAGLAVDSLDVLSLALLDQGVAPAGLSAAVGAELQQRGIRVNDTDGAPISDAKQAAARTGEIVERFTSRTLPVLMRYGIVSGA